jgi:hypothetical protein
MESTEFMLHFFEKKASEQPLLRFGLDVGFHISC